MGNVITEHGETQNARIQEVLMYNKLTKI